LATRFNTWDAKWAVRRRTIVLRLVEQLMPRTHRDIHRAAGQAAFLLDIGRSVDFFDRYKHAAMMVVDTELDGFSHRQIALLAAVIAKAADEDAKFPAVILKGLDLDDIQRAAVLLKLADNMLQYWPGNVAPAFTCRVTRSEVRISGPGLHALPYRGIGARFERRFRRRLIVGSDRT
jgi:hypothetical protein